jgi:protein-L-isoaspartate(D-aspartate) O-methyltransferase
VDDPSQAAERMVRTQLRPRGIRDPRVLDAMRHTPRHRFVPGVSGRIAYSDQALPTRDGQTISQPFVVAHMTQLLDVQPGVKLLEVGTGSGYQTAILAALGARVTSLERNPFLADAARRLLAELHPDADLSLHVGDGTLGWPADAPYDRILVTAAAPSLPLALEEQLAPGGRLVIPLGDRGRQALMVFERVGDELERRQDLDCRFVPLVGADGWAG